MMALEWSALAILALGHIARFLTVRCLAHSQERRERQLLQFLAARGDSAAACRPVAEALRELQTATGSMPAPHHRRCRSGERGA